MAIITMGFFFGCQEQPKQSVVPAAKAEVVYDMYDPSEMAQLMNKMYAHNQTLKQDILAGNIPVEFPMDFMEIHSAALTKANMRNETFEHFSRIFIEAEKAIYDPNALEPIEARFNTAINVCISCHQTSCTGPIPRIKKLLIK